MHDPDEPLNPAVESTDATVDTDAEVDADPAPAKAVENDTELDQLESDLESVDAALRALDSDEIDQAEALTVALGDEAPTED
jgi:hypothetical protein